jgi:hypothetical protein
MGCGVKPARFPHPAPYPPSPWERRNPPQHGGIGVERHDFPSSWFRSVYPRTLTRAALIVCAPVIAPTQQQRPDHRISCAPHDITHTRENP